MKRKAAKDFWKTYISLIVKGGIRTKMGNPAVTFTKQAKNGDFDEISDEKYCSMVDDVEQLSSFWDKLPTDTAGNVFLKALARTPLSEDEISQLTGILALASTNVSYILDDEKDMASAPDDDFEPAFGGTPFDENKFEWTPKSIYDYLDYNVYGQTAAKRAATMLIYNHLHNNSRNILMAGATGCGKTEIWRVLSQKFDFIKIINGPQLCCDGWKGSYHIKDIFISEPKEKAESMVIVIDEADKLFEPAVGGGGTDFSYKIQNELLKIMDGDTITFVDEQKNTSCTVDCTNVSVVFCGSFETMLRAKTLDSGTIGFGGELQKESRIAECTEEDLITYANVRREIAGRIQQIITLDKLTADDLEKILESQISPVKKIEKQQGISITVDERTRRAWRMPLPRAVWAAGISGPDSKAGWTIWFLNPPTPKNSLSLLRNPDPEQRSANGRAAIISGKTPLIAA